MKKAKPPRTVNLYVVDALTREYYAIRALPVYMDETDGKPRTIGAWHSELRAWSSLEISAQGDNEAPTRGHLNGLYAAQTRYHNVYEVDEETALGMHRMLKLVRESMDEYYRSFGHPRTFGQYASRVGAIIGVERMLFPNHYADYSEPWKDWGFSSTWAAAEFKAVTLGEGAEIIDHRIKCWQEKEGGVACA